MNKPISRRWVAAQPFVLPGLSRIARFVAKLERRTALRSDARDAFLSLPVSILKIAARENVIEERGESRRCFFILSGLVSRHRSVNGARRIVSLGVPGDAVNMQSLWFERQDQGVTAHSQTTLAAVEHDDLIRLCGTYPEIMRALWHDTLVEMAITRGWMLNVGHRLAQFRVAHLLLEMAARLEACDLVQSDMFELPLTQGELASATGLSLVHLNKSLKLLREQGYIKTEGRRVILLDRPGLEDAAGFDPAYLHIATEPTLPPSSLTVNAASLGRSNVDKKCCQAAVTECE